jgi:riboflavin kinase/FMN adenylyltransferase
MLGRPLALTGQLQAGAGRGHSLGFPTLNLVPEQECLPARGVYCTETLLEGQIFSSATNVGVRPTFNGNQLLVESHLLNFSGGRAGGRLEVRFYKRLREERKFASPKALVEQIALDVECTRRFFARRERSSIPPRRPLAAAP